MLCYSSILTAQQLPLLDNTGDLYDFLNPSFRGNNYLIYEEYEEDKWDCSFQLVHRNQWIGTGIKGTPTTSGIKFSGVKNNQWIVGGGLLRDAVGPFKNTKLFSKLAFSLFPESDDYSLTLGVGLLWGFQNAIIRNSLSVNNQQDPLYIGSKYFESSTYAAASGGFLGHYKFGNIKFLIGGAISQVGGHNLSGVFELKPHVLGNTAILIGTEKVFEISASFVSTEPIKHGNFRAILHLYNPNGRESFFNVGSFGLGYGTWNTVQANLAFLIKGESMRVGIVADLFRPSFKNINALAPSLEVQFSCYLSRLY